MCVACSILLTCDKFNCRSEQFQEQLWDISCNLLKGYLSPDIWREYGPSETEQQREEAAANGQEEEPQGPTKDGDEIESLPVSPVLSS